jgi:hypothetical protein
MDDPDSGHVMESSGMQTVLAISMDEVRGRSPGRSLSRLPGSCLFPLLSLTLILAPGCETTGRASSGDVSPETFEGPFGVVASELVEAPGHTGEGFQDATRAVNGVRGGGLFAGSTDVFSLGYEDGIDNVLTVSWGGDWVRNGHGVDFVVAENPFRPGGGTSVFMDPAIVHLSRDGQFWVPFPHDYIASDETVYVADPGMWPGFAGRFPVLFHEESNRVNPFDWEQAGGDPFDLDDLPLDGGEAEAIRTEGFRYLRLVTAPSRINPDTGAPYARDPASNGSDIDGVIARYVDPVF